MDANPSPQHEYESPLIEPYRGPLVEGGAINPLLTLPDEDANIALPPMLEDKLKPAPFDNRAAPLAGTNPTTLQSSPLSLETIAAVEMNSAAKCGILCAGVALFVLYIILSSIGDLLGPNIVRGLAWGPLLLIFLGLCFSSFGYYRYQQTPSGPSGGQVATAIIANAIVLLITIVAIIENG